MTKKQQIEYLAKETGMSQDDAGKFYTAMIEMVLDKAGDADNERKITIPGLGTFKTSMSKAREGRNPATGQPMQIEASWSLRFKQSAPVKARYNK